MGTMMMYKCNDCGFSKELHLGSGMMLPNASEKLKAAIASGEYGPELKGAYEKCELPVVCPESKVYECPRCGYWDVYQNASVYEPTDVAAARKKRFGAKTVAEWGEIPYVFEHELESDEYRLAHALLSKVRRRHAYASKSCREKRRGSQTQMPSLRGVERKLRVFRMLGLARGQSCLRNMDACE